LNAFARYDWSSPSRLYSGEANWSVGVMATWTVLSGGSDWADRRASSARADAAQAALDDARARADLDLERADNARRVALARLEIASRGADQSAEAHRIVSRKYEGGLASVVELLDAAAFETQARLALAAARWSGIVAAADLQRALGSDPAALADSLQAQIPGSDR
jgi:outer membrane protein TolC